MKTITGIVLTGLALVFAGCNSHTAHKEAADKAVKNRAGAERALDGVNITAAQSAAAVDQAAAKAQDAIATVQYTADKTVNDATRSAATVANDAQRAVSDANRLQNDAARSGQNVLDNAQRDLNALKNVVR